MQRVFVTSACRTPIGKTGGGLVNYTDTELMALIIEYIIKHNSEHRFPQEVIIGCCFPQEHRNLAKSASIMANMPFCIPAVTINRTCASSMEAVVQGYYRIRNGDADIVLVGGTENMNRNPHVMKMNIQNVRKYIKSGLPEMPYSLPEHMLLESIGMSVDILARNHNIERSEQDEYSIFSHEKAEIAWRKGRFNSELMPLYNLDEDTYIVKDEGINSSISPIVYEEATPIYFKNGTITKYNASSISDGASAMILMSEKSIKEYSIQPIVEIISSSLVGTTPGNIGVVAADAYLDLLYKNKLNDSDIQLIECNEAYAAQLIACVRRANWDIKRVNIYGGGLSLGHPLGCTGVRICTTLVHAMRGIGSNLGVATMCAGGGMGQAILFKLFDGEV